MDMGDRKWSPGCQHPHKDFCTCAISGRKAGSCFNLPVPEQVLVWHQLRTDTIEKNYLLMGYDCSQKKKNTPRVHPNLLMQKSMKFTYISA